MFVSIIKPLEKKRSYITNKNISHKGMHLKNVNILKFLLVIILKPIEHFRKQQMEGFAFVSSR